MNDIEQEFKKLFGDMYLSESETALRIFEYGYKAGVAAENELCAKVADSISDKYAFGFYGNEVDTADEIAAAIRARMKS